MKVGRNDPCPCKSGKKYKKCCLAIDPAQQGAPANGLRVLTGQSCATLLEDLRGVLSSAGFVLEHLELWNDLADLRWLSTQRGPVLRDFSNTHDETRQRSISGFKDAVFIKRSIKAIERTRSFPGWKDPASYLRFWRIRDVGGSEDSKPARQAQQAQDFLYEIEVAARLSFTFSKLRFAEPDLVIEDPESPFAWTIACKRPRSSKNIPALTYKAAKQINGQGHLGLVMLSFDNLVDDQVVVDLSGRSLAPACQSRMNAIVSICGKKILERLSPFLPSPGSAATKDGGVGVLGALTTASFLLLGKDGITGSTFLNTRMLTSMINRKSPAWANQAAYFLVKAMDAGEEKLRTRY